MPLKLTRESNMLGTKYTKYVFRIRPAVYLYGEKVESDSAVTNSKKRAVEIIMSSHKFIKRSALTLLTEEEIVLFGKAYPTIGCNVTSDDYS